jgi:serine/threonine protein kinase/Tol biopolymer transport system component
VTLQSGTRLGPYEILAPLGAGGMGEVYRARDTKLGRDAALKILPSAFTHDPERLARFRREARVLASLNHPHIAAIHGLEQADGHQFLVLELVEGETLAQRIARGPIPAQEALAIARQTAEALNAAHERGVIHRDLKPANIKVTPDGTVKVLDFGLAKAASRDGDGPDLAIAPTMTIDGTRAGVVLGTAAYMSPEQARGQVVDKRTDIWAFGCVLFEMITGKRAFEGEDLSETLATVLKGEPDWIAWPAHVPASIRILVQQCLEKNRTQRIADVTTALFVINNPAMTAPPVVASSTPPSRTRLTWTISAILAATALAAGGVAYFWRAPLDEHIYRSTILATVTADPNASGMLALSPDGSRLAFIGSDTDGHSLVYVRALDGLAALPLAGTENAQTLFWSPDGRFLAFIADNKLKKIESAGSGAAQVLCDALLALPGSWNQDGAILFTPTAGSPLFRVSAAGGTPSSVSALDTKAGETAHVYPFFLPDGRHFLYLAQASGGVPHGVYVGSLDSPERTRLLEGGSNVEYARGALLFLRGTTLMAQSFDASRRALTGEAMPLADKVQVSEVSGLLRTGTFSVSETGALVYRADTSGGSDLVWFDRTGHELGRLGDRAKYLDTALSPDGTHASVSVMEPGTATRDVWIYDVARGLRNRLTFDPEDDLDAKWSADGSRVIYASRRKGHMDLYVKTASGADSDQVLWADGVDKYPQSWSPDGRFLLYVTLGGPTGQDLWVLPLSGDERKPFRFLQTRFNNGTGQFSPDGHWIVYRSNETGRFEIYVAPFPGPGGKWQISTTGGTLPRWRRDSKEILYVAPSNTLMAAAVTVEASRVEVGPVRALFQLHPVTPRYFYDVTPDGQRFLVNTADERAASTPLTLVVNWRALLKR